MSNTADEHARLKEIFLSIIDLPADARQDKAASMTDDAALISRAFQLVERMEGVATLRTRNVVSHPSAPSTNDPVANIIDIALGPELNLGDTVGAWQLQSLLGQGGMGSVFLAKRNDGHFEQQAAVKILQGLPTEDALALLTKERQILASLTHPNIAHLLDGGATPRGQPYLVIEYVRGVAIDKYCQVNKLKRDDILQLIITICEAVSFAHQQLIIHCDIKPSNVLVDNSGRPVLLDFGIARLVDQVEQGEQGDANESSESNEDSDIVTVTPFGTTTITTIARRKVASSSSTTPSSITPSSSPLAFTPRYASPEQSRGELIGTASDIYSIGALTNALIFRQPLATTCAQANAKLSSRDVELVGIIRKATASTPIERYASAQALARDIKRYLAHLPVHALPSQPIYIAKKLIQRRWGVALAGSVFFATIAVFTVGLINERNSATAAEADARSQRDIANAERDKASIERDNAAESQAVALNAETIAITERDRASAAQKLAIFERDRAIAAQQDAVTQRNIAVEAVKKSVAAEALAKTEAQTTREVSEFMDSLFVGADPNLNKGVDLTARVLVERGRDRINTLNDQPQMQARLKSSLANVFNKLGQPRDALRLWEEALVFERAAMPPNSPRIAGLLAGIAQIKYAEGQLAEAEKFAREALPLSVQSIGADSPLTASIKGILGRALSLQRKTNEAEPLLMDALRIQAMQKDGKQSSEYASALTGISLYYRWTGDFNKSIEFTEQALAIYKPLLGEEHPHTLSAMRDLAFSLTGLRRYEEAEAAYRNVLRVRRKIFPAQSVAIANSIADLGSTIIKAGRYREAISVLGEAQDIYANTAGKSSQIYSVALEQVAHAYSGMGDIVNAEKYYRESIAIRSAAIGEDNIAVTRVRHILAMMLMRSADTGSLLGVSNTTVTRETSMREVKKMLDRVYEIRKKTQVADFPEMLDSAIALAEWEMLNGEPKAARVRLDAVEQLPQLTRRTNVQKNALLRVSAFASIKLGDTVQALKDIQAHEKAIIFAVGINHPDTAIAMLDHAEILLAAKQKLEAARLARQLKAGVLGSSDTFVENAPQRKRLALLLASTADIAN
jgi:eukaryotic-like serine/threonine-protein kinase